MQPEKTIHEAPFRREILRSTIGGQVNQPLVPLLPATFRQDYRLRLVSDSVNDFLESEFDLTRLKCIHNWLWICGLPSSPRSLHYQQLKNREIVVSEVFDLHLVWSPTRIFIKPLPRYLLSPSFWREHVCPSTPLYETCIGFLLSYIALIEREVDFKIAIEKALIPAEVSWQSWLAFAEGVFLFSSQATSHKSAQKEDTTMHAKSTTEPHAPVNPRFYYGELRLGRLNWIYRLILGKPRGYLSGCTTYSAFIRENTNSLITLFAYTTIVLSAMQVGLATPWLAEDFAFGMSSYVFSVFAIVAPLLAILGLLSILAVLFTINLLRTLRIRKKRRLQGAAV
jgi:hypothetical protein